MPLGAYGGNSVAEFFALQLAKATHRRDATAIWSEPGRSSRTPHPAPTSTNPPPSKERGGVFPARMALEAARAAAASSALNASAAARPSGGHATARGGRGGSLSPWLRFW